MVSLGELNPLKNFDIGIGLIGSALLVLFVAIFLLCVIGIIIFLYINKRKYKYKIPLTKKVGNRTIRVKTFRAKDFPIGLAGDKLWFIKGIKKYISPATLQTAPNEYTHHEREDGEWINVEYPDVDEHMRQLKVKFVQQDMRSNRIAIADILEQRFKDQKTFWEKWGNMIMQVVFYLIVTMMMVVIFYQWSDIVTQVGGLVDKLAVTNAQCGGGSIIPAMLLIRGLKK